ncbi:MAG: PAS domain S-box protein [Candidatus Lokiarchaeota archaeon]|nr:PAS domain S-box protein [Candidatus Lokiarchaeota archaeon]
MTKAKVLIVDDEPHLLSLAKRFLERENSNIEVVTVKTAADALDLIERTEFDIIVSDYQMREMDGLELLEIIRESGNDIPFIIWTGRSREEVAIRALNLGATHYVKKGADIKSQYVQLCHLITQAVEHHRAHYALIESEEKYRTLTEESIFGVEIFRVDPFEVLYVNNAMTRILGYPTEEFYNADMQALQEIMHPDDMKKYAEIIEKLAKREKIHLENIRLKHSDGHYVHIQVSVSQIAFQGEPCHIGFAIDITDLVKKSKEIEEKTSLLEGINRILLEAHSSNDREAIGKIALSIAKQITDSKYGAILSLLGNEEIDFWVVADEVIRDTTVSRPEEGFPYSGAWGKAILEGKSLYINDYASSFPDFDPPEGHIDIESVLIVPIKTAETRRGVIGLANKPGGYSSSDLEMIETLSITIAEILITTHQEELFRRIQQISPLYLDLLDTIFIALDDRGRVVSANKTACKVLDISQHEIFGMDWFRFFVPPEESDEVRHVFDSMISGEIDPVEIYTNQVITTSGEKRLIRWYNTYYRNSDGEIAGSYSTGIDVTEAHQMELELSKKEKMYQTLFEGADIPIMLVSEEGKYLDANPAALEFLECSLEELKTKYVWDFSVDVEQDKSDHSPFVSSRQNITKYIINGKVKVLSLTVHPVESVDGTVLFGIGIDITDQIEEQEAFLIEAKQQKAFLDSLRDGVWYLDSEWKTQYVNPMMAEILGYSVDEMKGKGLLDFVFPEHLEETVAKMQAREEGEVEDHEFIFQRKNGSSIFTEVRASPVFDETGQVIGAIAAVSDMTKWKESEQKLVKQKEELSDFAHRMSHDLKALLHNILGYNELIEEENESAFTEGIRRQVDRIQSLLERSVELADSGQIIGKKEPLSLEHLLDELRSEYLSDSVRLEIGELPKVRGDRYKLDQVFSNLIRNAIEHADPTTISVTSEAHEDYSDILVRNDGLPIDPELRPLLLTSQISSKAGGGMGLVIVERIIQAHHWKISLDKTEKTIFRIRIPKSDIVSEGHIS